MFMVYHMSVTVSIKVRKELVDLADKMMKYGLARSRSHAFNIMIERGLKKVYEEVGFWDKTYDKIDKLTEKGMRIKHGGLNKILEEDRMS